MQQPVMNYLDEILTARDRTIRFKLNCPDISPVAIRFINQDKLQQFPYAVREAVGDLSDKELVAQCFGVNWQLHETLESYFNTPILYTLGYVYMPPDYLFKQTEEQLLQLMKNGITETQVNLHAWLTLPSMEIVDISLLTSIAVLNGWDKGRGGVIAAHAHELNHGVRYHPMLLGTDYLKKIGAMHEFPTLTT